MPRTPHPDRGEGCLFERFQRVILRDNAPFHGNRRILEKQMATTRYNPSLTFQNDSESRAGLLPLAFAAIGACTALSVEAWFPRLDDQLWRVGIVDLVVNVGLYVPLGVALRRRGALSAVGFAAALSLIVEAMQLFYPDRYTAWSDVVANVFGALSGWYLSNRLDPRSAWGLDPLRLTARLAIFSVLLYVAVVVGLALPSPRSDFSNWDPSFRVMAGDGSKRHRPWRGEIDAVAVFDECLSREDIGRLSREDPGSALDANVPAEHPLFAAGRVDSLDFTRGMALVGASENRRLFDALVAQGRLTLVVWFRTRSENEDEPARIVSFSDTPWKQNFGLEQHGREVVFRLRTPTTDPDGFLPQVKTRALLESNKPTFVAATYDGRISRVYVDGHPEGRVNLYAYGKRAVFFADSGLPAIAMFLGALMAVAWVVAAKRRGSSVRLWGTTGGLLGGVLFVISGGASALPQFAVWVPVVAAFGGLAVGFAVTEGPEGLTAE